MAYIYLFLSVFLSAASSIFGKLFNIHNEGKTDSSAFYNFFLLISVCLGWLTLYLSNPDFNIGVIGYSILFAISFTVCNIGIINALKHGPATLTSMFVGLSLILTTVWGFIFWNVKVTVTAIIGIVSVAVAIYLCLYTNESDEKPISWKWLFFVMLAFFGNAGCSIIQRTQQMKFKGQYGNIFMLFAMVFSAITFLLMYIKSDKRDTLSMLKKSWWQPVCAGVCNVFVNFFVIILSQTTLSPSLIYPVIGVGSLIVVTVFSLIIFKEKMIWQKRLGFVIGIVAIGMLSI